jgi:hypothetical protein
MIVKSPKTCGCVWFVEILDVEGNSLMDPVVTIMVLTISKRQDMQSAVNWVLSPQKGMQVRIRLLPFQYP